MAAADLDDLRNEIADGSTTVHCGPKKPGIGSSLLKYFLVAGLATGGIAAAGAHVVNDINKKISANYTILENIASSKIEGERAGHLSRMAAESIPGFDADIPQHARAQAAMGFLGQIMDEVDLSGKIDATVAVGKTDVPSNPFQMTFSLTSDDGITTTCGTIRSHGVDEDVVDLGQRSLFSWHYDTTDAVEAVRYQVAKAVYDCFAQDSSAAVDDLGAMNLAVFDNDVHNISTVIGGATLYKTVHPDPSDANQFLTGLAEVLRSPHLDGGASDLTGTLTADGLSSVISVMDTGRDYLLDATDVISMAATTSAFAAGFKHVEGSTWTAPNTKLISTNPADSNFGWDIADTDNGPVSKRRFIDVTDYKTGAFEDPFGFTFDAHGAQFVGDVPLPKLRPLGIVKKAVNQGYDHLIPKAEDMPPVEKIAFKV